MSSTLIVFDFDDTIAAVNVEDHMLASPVDAAFGGEARVAALNALFHELHGAGITLAVLSFNSHDILTRALSSVNLLQYFHPTFIFGREVAMDLDNRDKGVTVRDRIVAVMATMHNEPPGDNMTVTVSDGGSEAPDARGAAPNRGGSMPSLKVTAAAPPTASHRAKQQQLQTLSTPPEVFTRFGGATPPVSPKWPPKHHAKKKTGLETKTNPKTKTSSSNVFSSLSALPPIAMIKSTTAAPAPLAADTAAATACGKIRLLFVDDKQRNCKMVQDKCDGAEALHVAEEGGICKWEWEMIRKWAFEGLSITQKMLAERRASLAQAQVTKMKEKMLKPPTTLKAWREHFVDSVISSGNARNTKQLVVAIMLLTDGELKLVPGLDVVAGSVSKTKDAAVKSQILSKWLTDNKAAVVKFWEKLEFPEHPEYFDKSAATAAAAAAGAGKMVIFDFDQTLTKVHVEREQLQIKSLVNVVFGGETRVALLNDLFAELYAHGILIGMCSFNSISTIMRALEMRGAADGTNLLQYFDPELMFGQEVTDDIDGRDKGVTVRDRFLNNLKRGSKVLSNKALFVDDTQQHCTAVSSTCKGVETMTVAGFEGLVESELNAIRRWALEG